MPREKKEPPPPFPSSMPSDTAMTAAMAAGVYRDFDEAGRAMVAIEKTVEPKPAHAAVYDDLFGRYVELYKKLNLP